MKVLIDILRWLGAKIVLILGLLVSLTSLYTYQPEMNDFLDKLSFEQGPPEIIDTANHMKEQIKEIEQQISEYDGLIKDREDNRPPRYKIFARRAYDAQTTSLDYEEKRLQAIEEKKAKQHELANLFPLKKLIDTAKLRIEELEKVIEERGKIVLHGISSRQDYNMMRRQKL